MQSSPKAARGRHQVSSYCSHWEGEPGPLQQTKTLGTKSEGSLNSMFRVRTPDQPATAKRDATGLLLLSGLLDRPLAAAVRSFCSAPLQPPF